jgi:competence protein ComEC
MSATDRSVVGGLLYGDDRRLSESVVGDFRRSGLAHLSAVSGQNVAFLLAALSPLLARQSRLARTVTVLVVLATFVLLTRAEPSVIRASLMAAIAVSARTWGLPLESASALGLATTIGVLIDPMLVWSIGWWMSIAGCVGLVVVAPLVGGRAGVRGPALHQHDRWSGRYRAAGRGDRCGGYSNPSHRYGNLPAWESSSSTAPTKSSSPKKSYG